MLTLTKLGWFKNALIGLGVSLKSSACALYAKVGKVYFERKMKHGELIT